jgi:site-specific recombinase XerD
LDAWLSERNPECGHEFLIYNEFKGPMRYQALRKRLRAVFDGDKPRAVTGEVFKGFKLHRLRHTMATRLINHGVDMKVVMAMGGWLDQDSVLFYAKILPETIESSYHLAMERIRTEREQGRESVMSLEDYASRNLPNPEGP